jgi:hypothetical protein
MCSTIPKECSSPAKLRNIWETNKCRVCNTFYLLIDVIKCIIYSFIFKILPKVKPSVLFQNCCCVDWPLIYLITKYTTGCIPWKKVYYKVRNHGKQGLQSISGRNPVWVSTTAGYPYWSISWLPLVFPGNYWDNNFFELHHFMLRILSFLFHIILTVDFGECD